MELKRRTDQRTREWEDSTENGFEKMLFNHKKKQNPTIPDEKIQDEVDKEREDWFKYKRHMWRSRFNWEERTEAERDVESVDAQLTSRVFLHTGTLGWMIADDESRTMECKSSHTMLPDNLTQAFGNKNLREDGQKV